MLLEMPSGSDVERFQIRCISCSDSSKLVSVDLPGFAVAGAAHVVRRRFRFISFFDGGSIDAIGNWVDCFLDVDLCVDFCALLVCAGTLNGDRVYDQRRILLVPSASRYSAGLRKVRLQTPANPLGSLVVAGEMSFFWSRFPRWLLLSRRSGGVGCAQCRWSCAHCPRCMRNPLLRSGRRGLGFSRSVNVQSPP